MRRSQLHLIFEKFPLFSGDALRPRWPVKAVDAWKMSLEGWFARPVEHRDF